MNIEPSELEYENAPIFLASRFKRFVATLVNSVLLWAIFLLAMYLGGFFSDEDFYEQDHSLFPIIVFAGLGLYFIFQFYFIYKNAQSIGKYLMRIKVIDYSTQQKISVGHYISREVLEQFFAITTILTIVSIITAFCNKERRSLIDMAVGTVVVKV